MTDLTNLTVAAIRDGVRDGDFTAVEVATAFNANVAAAKALNAFIVETPHMALDAAKVADDLSGGFVVSGTFDPVGPEPIEAGAIEGPADSAPLQLSGIAARLRTLPRPISPEAAAELLELHSRLGLLHAQMAEALRVRR